MEASGIQDFELIYGLDHEQIALKRDACLVASDELKTRFKESSNYASSFNDEDFPEGSYFAIADKNGVKKGDQICIYYGTKNNRYRIINMGFLI